MKKLSRLSSVLLLFVVSGCSPDPDQKAQPPEIILVLEDMGEASDMASPEDLSSPSEDMGG